MFYRGFLDDRSDKIRTGTVARLCESDIQPAAHRYVSRVDPEVAVSTEEAILYIIPVQIQDRNRPLLDPSLAGPVSTCIRISHFPERSAC